MPMLCHLRSRFKQLPFALALLVTLCAMSFIVPQAHAAATGRHASLHVALPQTDVADCRSLGKLVASYAADLSNGSQIGTLDLYYNSATGYNCAYMRSVGSAYGQATYIDIYLNVCQQTSSGPNCTNISDVRGLYYDTDAGPYKYYAGPVGVYGKGHCISVTGEVWWNNQSALTGSDGASHCG